MQGLNTYKEVNSFFLKIRNKKNNRYELNTHEEKLTLASVKKEFFA